MCVPGLPGYLSIMLARRLPVALLLASLVVAAGGCGSGSGAGAGGDNATNDAAGSNGDNTLAESDIASVLDAKRRIDAACGSDGSGTPDRSIGEISGAVSTLVSVTGQYPDRVYETGNEDHAVKMTLVSAQVMQQLRQCGIPAQADRLAKVAKS